MAKAKAKAKALKTTMEMEMEMTNPTPGILYAILVSDTTLVGAQETENNLVTFVKTIPEICLRPLKVVVYRVSVHTVLAQRQTLVVHLVDMLRSLETSSKENAESFLFLSINGHSRIYRDQEAIHFAKMTGENNMLARDGTRPRISTMVAKMGGREIPLLTPSFMMIVLNAIPKTIRRTILFLDTCHSMSLVSVLLCPPIDIRIIHSTAEDEKTWQSSNGGSIMSQAWKNAVLVFKQEIAKIDKKNNQHQFHEEMLHSFWTCTQLVAHQIQAQILTTGPGQAFFFY